MSHDFSQHQALIDSFRGKVNAIDFDDKFSQATTAIASTEKFLLKMELKRLAKPCARHIDLNGFVDGECKLFNYQGQTHFLDALAIDVFNAAVTEYGEYTLGVFETVKNTENNFRVRYEKEKKEEEGQLKVDSSDSQYDNLVELSQNPIHPLQTYTIGHYQDRIEERMNYVIDIELILPNNLKVLAQTSDLSVKGCKIKLDANHYLQDEDIIKVRFTGLEQMFSFGRTTSFEYKIKNTGVEELKYFVGSARAAKEDTDDFMAFLSGFIQGNKRRYKINLDNTISALKARSFEQYIFPVMTDMPIFMKSRHVGGDMPRNGELSSMFEPYYTLTNTQNMALFEYWKNEKGESTLPLLINNERYRRLQEQAKIGKNLIVYSFINESKGALFFYSADNLQLKEGASDFYQFVSYLCAKPSFKVTSLSLQPLNTNNASSPFALSGTTQTIHSANKKGSRQHCNSKMLDHVKKQIHHLSSIVVAKDITHQHMLDDFKLLAEKLDKSDIDTNIVKKYGHKRQSLPQAIINMPLHFDVENDEEVYQYQTDITVKSKTLCKEGKTLELSISEISLQLDNVKSLRKGDVLLISFSSLQERAPSFTLRSLAYSVLYVDNDKNQATLRAILEEGEHGGVTFFKTFISKVLNKKPDSQLKKEAIENKALALPGMMTALRNMYSASFNTPTLMIQKKESAYTIESLVSAKGNNTLSDEPAFKILKELKGLSTKEQNVNGYPLVNFLLSDGRLNNYMKNLHQGGFDVITENLLIAVKESNSHSNEGILIKTPQEFEALKDQKTFIETALSQGHFFSVQLKIGKTKHVENDYLAQELEYIKIYSPHKSKQVEQDFLNVKGVIQIVDVTQEVLLRNALI